ncbi:MAG TPA: hypothetical protein VM198_08625 [Longimicrobiales bacterium]|nr:hypothetical protein [Longimicrobiales bacterium]
MTEALQQEIRTLRSLHNSDRDPEGRVFAPLADAYRRAGQFPEAVRLLNDGLSRLPDFVSGHVVAAQLYVEQGLAEEAGFAARRALELDADNVNALGSLLRVLEEKGDVAEAAEVRDHLVALEPDFGTREDIEPQAEPGVDAVAFAGGLGALTLSPAEPEAAELASQPDAGDADALAEPVFDLGDLTVDADSESLGGAFDAGPHGPDDAMVGLDSLAPDPEPVFELESLMRGPETDEAVDIGLLSADEPAPVDTATLPEEEPVLELAALAPDEPEEPVLDLAALAPDEPEEPVLELAALAPDEPEEPVLDVAALAPDEPEEPVLDVAALAPDEPEEPVLDMAVLAPDEPEEPVLDVAALAPDEPEEPVLDMAALAPDEPDEPEEPDEAEEAVLDMAALAPEPAAGTEVDDVIDVDFLAPNEPDEIVIDLDALRPDGVDTEGSEEEAETVAPPVEDDDPDDEGAGGPVYTRTLAELYVKQGAVDRALGVLRHLSASDPDNRELADRIAQLEEGGDGAVAELEGEAPGRRPEQSDASDEPEEEVESLARDLAQSGEGAHDVDTPFAWGEQEAEEPPSEGPTIRDYFDGLLSWEPEEDA